MVKNILKWIPAFFIACCSFYLSSQEHIEHMPDFWNADKVVHFFCFAGFSFWTAFACNIKSYKMTWLPTLIISIWAITDEIHQSFTPGRDASILDWGADTTGAFLGAVIFIWLVNSLLPYFSKNQKSVSRIIIFSVFAEVLNFFSAWVVVDILRFPLFADTIGTVFIVLYAGLVPGLIVSGMYNIIMTLFMSFIGNPFYPWEMLYSLCGMTIAFFVWIFSWKNQNLHYTKTITILYLVLISLMSALASSIIGGAVETFQRIFFTDQIYISPVKSFVTAFLGDNIGLFASCTFARIPVTVLDRLICTFLGFGVYMFFRQKAPIEHSV